MRLVVFLAACVCASPALAKPGDTWMAVMLDGRKIGKMVVSREVADGNVTTAQTLDMSLDRGKTPLVVRSEITSVETPSGQPISFIAKTRSSATEDVVEGTTRNDGTFQLAATVGNAQKISVMVWPDGAMLSEAQRSTMLRHGFRPGTQYTMRNFDAVRQRAVPMAVSVIGDEIVTLPQGTETLHHLRQSLPTDTSGAAIDLWVNDQGAVRRSLSPLLGFRLEMAACDQACAEAPVQNIDVLRTSMVQSPRLISFQMRTQAIRYTLSYRGKGAAPFIDTDEQRVRAIGDGLYEMTVMTPQAHDDTPPPKPEDTAPNAWVQSAAPAVIALAKEAVGGATTDLQRMRRLRSFVSGYIVGHGTDVGYASALETIETRQGDCTEYAVLLAAMARSLGIPTRIATGLVYSDRYAGATRMFVPHTWDQAWITDRWVSFDAAQRQFDSTHIALSVGNGDPWRFFGIMGVLGDMRISRAVAPMENQLPPGRDYSNPAAQPQQRGMTATPAAVPSGRT